MSSLNYASPLYEIVISKEEIALCLQPTKNITMYFRIRNILLCDISKMYVIFGNGINWDVINAKIEIVIGGQKMIQVQHVSFRDWNPIGKPRKKPKEKSENLSESVKCGTSNAEKLSIKTTAKKEDPFGVAATLELTHSYVKDNNFATKYSADKESNFLGQ